MVSRKSTTKKTTGQKKRLDTLAVKTEAQKVTVLEQLARSTSVGGAMRQAGVGRSTYYDWYQSDRVFAKQAEKAIDAGRQLWNDIAISKLQEQITEGVITAIIFWLKNNHPWFSEKVWHQHLHEHKLTEPEVKELPPEQLRQLVSSFLHSGLGNVLSRHEEAKAAFLASKGSEDSSHSEEGGLEDPHHKIREASPNAPKEKKGVSIAELRKRFGG